MALRGWRFIGVAGTIVAYVAGILILSIISLQNPQQRRGRNDRHYAENNLQQHEIGLLKRPLLRWCSELKFLGHQKSPFAVKSVKPLETFPGHPVKSNRDFILDSSDRSDTKLFVDSYFSSTNHRNRNTNNNSNNSNNSNNKNLKSSDNVSEFTIKTEPLKPNYNYKSKLINKNDDSDVSDTTILREKIVALASFPGSGNTWLRYLLQQATGILTGSVYKDYGLLKSGFPAESISNSSVLVVKTHEWGSNSWTKFTKAILLIRDPAKSILAEFNRQSGGHIGFASPDRYKRTKGKYWSKFVKNKLWSWEQTNLAWGKNYTGELKIVYYDDLVEEVENTLRDILTFLEFPINEDLMSCTISRKEGIYRRKKRLLNFDPYSPQMHKLISSTAAVVYAELGRTKFHSTRH